MPAPPAAAVTTVALIGNPNTGKSTLFNALAGVRQRVGNYPGVTVEKKVGQMTHEGRRFTLVDLPGTYSLAPRSLDEMVAVDVLLGRRDDAPRPDVALCIVDASNLQRNLYLVSQVLDTGLPVVVALNMTDVARSRGQEIDARKLSERLGAPVVEMAAHRRVGLGELRAALAAASDSANVSRESPFPAEFRAEVDRLEQCTTAGNGRPAPADHAPLPRFLVERVLLDTTGYLEELLLRHDHIDLRREVAASRERLAAAGCPVPAVEAIARYGWAGRALEGVVRQPAERRASTSDRLDRVLTHWLTGSLVFVALMAVMFEAVFRWATTPMDWIDAGMGRVAELAGQTMPEGALASLVTDGLIGGVGGVLVFLPQILILFLFIAVLEDCGYMARAAYLMDRVMSRVGLSGKSFIPLLSSFACAIPGVMAARVIENRRDRLTTILIAPLMSCSARLPVYVLLIAAFVPDRAYLGGWLSLHSLTMLSMYLLGMVTAAVVALVLKKTILRGPTPPFVMELPSYKWPSPATVVHRMLDRGWAFVRRAGTLIVAVAIVVWAALYYPRDAEQVEAPFAARRAAIVDRLSSLPANAAEHETAEQELAQLENEIAGAYQRQSILGRMGRFIEPAVRPLGWDWRIGSAVIASFPAREVVVATLGVIYNLGGDVEVEGEQARPLVEALRSAEWEGTDRKVFTLPVALSIMVFFALCAQCAATLVVIKRETNSWGWPAFTFIYMTALAYLAALATYQIGSRIG